MSSHTHLSSHVPGRQPGHTACEQHAQHARTHGDGVVAVPRHRPHIQGGYIKNADADAVQDCCHPTACDWCDSGLGPPWLSPAALSVNLEPCE